jgi:hypothetical protein
MRRISDDIGSGDGVDPYSAEGLAQAAEDRLESAAAFGGSPDPYPEEYLDDDDSEDDDASSDA